MDICDTKTWDGIYGAMETPESEVAEESRFMKSEIHVRILIVLLVSVP